MPADTTVKYFTSAMTDAPTLANVAGNLIAVLDACLVNGFGLKTCGSVVISGGVGTANISTGHSAIPRSVVLFAGADGSYTALNGERKVTNTGTTQILFDASDLADGTATGTITVKLAPAGWGKAFSGTNLAAYKSLNVQASGLYARFDDTTTPYAMVRGCEAMTDINTVTNYFPTVAQAAHSSWPKASSAVAKNWWIIANSRMVYFGVAPYAAAANQYMIYGFGDFVSRRAGDSYRFAVFSAGADASSNITYVQNPIPCTTYGKQYAARNYFSTGSPVVLTKTWLDALALSGYLGKTFPNPEDNGVIFSPMLVLEGATYRGVMPGVFATPQAIGSNLANGTVLDGVPGYERAVVYQQASYDAGGSSGGLFFDITGPWDVS